MYIIINKKSGWVKTFGKLKGLKDQKAKLSNDAFNDEFYIFCCGYDVYYEHQFVNNGTAFNYFGSKNYWNFEDLNNLSQTIKNAAKKEL